jgi:hypothetical protein
MNLDTAVAAHAEWKTKLRVYIGKHDHSLEAGKVGADDGCELGKWMKGEGGKYASLPDFVALKAEHAKFHKAAAAVVAAVNANELQKAEQLIANGSAYATVSTAVVGLIQKVKKGVA